jgi:GAF domain-containing protein
MRRRSRAGDDEFPLGREFATRFGHRTTLSVPLIREGRVLGAILVRRTEVRPFEPKHIALLTTFANQAAIAIENVRLFEAEQQRTRELTESLEQQTATSEVLQVISSSPGDLQPVFDSMLQNAARICDAKFGNIFRWDGEAMHIVGSHNTPPALVEARTRSPLRPHPNSPLDRMLRAMTVTHIADAAAEKAYTEQREPGIVDAVELGGMRTILLVPMLKENELIGVFSLYRQEVRPFTDKQIELVQNFGNQAVIAIENTRLLNEQRESLEQQTATAEILQLINSSPGDLDPVFDAMLEKAMRRCEATFGGLTSYDGERFHTLASRGLTSEATDAFREPWTAGPGSYHDELVRGESLVHTDLNTNDKVRRAHPQSRAVRTAAHALCC